MEADAAVTVRIQSQCRNTVQTRLPARGDYVIAKALSRIKSY